MGGVWLPPKDHANPLTIQLSQADRLVSPCLWREPFPLSIQAQVVPSDNLTGKITNSDLELAGTIAHDDVLASTVPVCHLTTCTFSDNTPAIVWQTKGSTTTSGPAAYLFQVSALHCQHFWYKTELHHIPSDHNSMADNCSQLWHLTDDQLLTYFNSTYPQLRSWKMLCLWPKMSSALISSLLR